MLRVKWRSVRSERPVVGFRYSLTSYLSPLTSKNERPPRSHPPHPPCRLLPVGNLREAFPSLRLHLDSRSGSRLLRRAPSHRKIPPRLQVNLIIPPVTAPYIAIGQNCCAPPRRILQSPSKNSSIQEIAVFSLSQHVTLLRYYAITFTFGEYHSLICLYYYIIIYIIIHIII